MAPFLSKIPPARQARWAAGVAFERDIGRLHRLGARPVGELVREVLQLVDDDAADQIRERLAVYAALDPGLVAALGGCDFPRPPLHAVERDDAGDAREAAA